MTFAQHFTLFYRVKQTCKITHINQNLEDCVTLILEFAKAYLQT